MKIFEWIMHLLPPKLSVQLQPSLVNEGVFGNKLARTILKCTPAGGVGECGEHALWHFGPLVMKWLVKPVRFHDTAHEQWIVYKCLGTFTT